MQLRHSFLYLLAHGVPALAAFLTLAVYTRWISPEAYGIYTTLMVIANSINIILFNWVYVALLRYWNDKNFKQAELMGLLLSVLAVGSLLILLGTSIYCSLTQDIPMSMALAGLMISNAVYMAYQRLNSANLQAERYLKIEVLRVVVTALLAIILVWQGYSWYGILFATSLGFLVPLVVPHFWQGFFQYSVKLRSTQALILLRYGLPLSLSFILLEVIHATDRVLLSYLVGFEAAGQYAVAFSLPFQLLILIGSALNAAAYPLILQSLEQQGEPIAKSKLADYLLVLVGLLLPSYLGLLAVSHDFMPLLIGEAYLAESIRLLPSIGLLLVLNAIYLFHTSLAFQLAKKTYMPILVIGVAALLNVFLNFVLIPIYKIDGAVLASLVAYLVCIVYGRFLGDRVFKLPVLWGELLKIIASASLMFLILKYLPLEHGVLVGLLRIVVGVILYSFFIYYFNVQNIRFYLPNLLKGIHKSHESTQSSA
ncbi:MAG: polysaccharide biosynthesis protein [Thiothrix sp.]|nr:MAG: polysaccharide biosynthesis protein [Thiothrix sp.]